MAAKFTQTQSIKIVIFGDNAAAKAQNNKILKLNDALQWIWTALPKKSIVKGVKDFCKQLEACMPANWGYLENEM